MLNFHSFATEEIFSNTPYPSGNSNLPYLHVFKCFGLTECSHPQEIPILLWREYGYFLELHIVNKSAVAVELTSVHILKSFQ